jgi:hypothetical protein
MFAQNGNYYYQYNHKYSSTICDFNVKINVINKYIQFGTLTII